MKNKNLSSKYSENLTSREQEILNLLLEGDSSKEIAFKLKISPRTVDYHRNNIYNKLDVHNYQELIAKRSSIDTKQEGAEPPAQIDSANTDFSSGQRLKIKRLYKLLIPAAIFILIISIIPLWYFTIKAYFSKSPEETQAVHVFIDHTYDTLYLRANRYSNDDLYGQCYSTLLQDIKFRHFYSGTLDDLLPIPYDWYTVRISGTAEMELKNVKLNLALLPYGEGDWIYLGGGDNKYVSIGPGYFSIETDIKKIFVNVSELPPGEIVFILVADLFQVHNKNPEYSFDSGLRIPDDVPDHTIITTVRNFKIEPVINTLRLSSSVTSARVFSEIPLRVNRWTSFYGHGENWSSTNEIKLSDFFTGEIKNILKTDQEISYIKLSGNIDTTLKNAYISFHWVVKDGYWGSGEYLFKWLSLGCSSIFSDLDFDFKKVAPDKFGKFEVIFPVKYNKYNDYLNAFDLPPGEVFLTINEMINNVHTSYKPHNVDFGIVPENIPDGAVMSTIKNMIIEPYDPNL